MGQMSLNSLRLHARQPCTFFKSYVHSSFFASFCHMLLHLVCTAEITVKQVIIKQKEEITVKQVIIKQKEKNINKIDTIKLV